MAHEWARAGMRRGSQVWLDFRECEIREASSPFGQNEFTNSNEIHLGCLAPLSQLVCTRKQSEFVVESANKCSAATVADSLLHSFRAFVNSCKQSDQAGHRFHQLKWRVRKLWQRFVIVGAADCRPRQLETCIVLLLSLLSSVQCGPGLFVLLSRVSRANMSKTRALVGVGIIQ
jgi:hypothetical protein